MIWKLATQLLRTVIVLAAIGIAITRSYAQVTLRQGTNADLEVKEFASPVTAEIPLGDFRNVKDGTTWDAPSLGKFYCDDVAIAAVDITKSSYPAKKTVKLKIWTQLNARVQEDDKSVALEFAIQGGDRRVYLGRIDNIAVDAGDHRTTSESFKLALADYDELFAAAQTPVLKVTMVVRTN